VFTEGLVVLSLDFGLVRPLSVVGLFRLGDVSVCEGFGEVECDDKVAAGALLSKGVATVGASRSSGCGGALGRRAMAAPRVGAGKGPHS